MDGLTWTKSYRSTEIVRAILVRTFGYLFPRGPGQPEATNLSVPHDLDPSIQFNQGETHARVVEMKRTSTAYATDAKDKDLGGGNTTATSKSADSHPHQQLLTKADVPALPRKKKNATPADKAARDNIMQQRRTMQERLREQTRDRSSRIRPGKDDDCARRAIHRSLKAPAVALSAVEAAALPITFDSLGTLGKAIKHATTHLDRCGR